MATKLTIDDRLVKKARKARNHRSRSEAVNAALSEYVRRRKQQGIIKLFGTIDYDEDYDYKLLRRMKR
jgi:metal-responsive CopG/Arc/MetJ family transcriptional regulator